MKILNQRYFGLIARCNSCGCLIGYDANDVSPNQNLVCPQCKFTLWVPLNPTYDGIIKDEEEIEKEVTDGEVDIPEQQESRENDS